MALTAHRLQRGPSSVYRRPDGVQSPHETPRVWRFHEVPTPLSSQRIVLFENEPSFRPDWLSLRDTLDSIRDEDLITTHDSARAKRPDCKSLSDAINELLRSNLDPTRWSSESAIFNDSEYEEGRNPLAPRFRKQDDGG